MSVGVGIAAYVAATGFLVAVRTRDERTRKAREYEEHHREFKNARERRLRRKRARYRVATIGADLRN